MSTINARHILVLLLLTLPANGREAGDILIDRLNDIHNRTHNTEDHHDADDKEPEKPPAEHTAHLVSTKQDLCDTQTITIQGIKSSWVGDAEELTETFVKTTKWDGSCYDKWIDLTSCAIFENTNPSASPYGIRKIWARRGYAVIDEYVTVEFNDGRQIWFKQPSSWRGRESRGMHNDTWIRGDCQRGGMVARVFEEPIAIIGALSSIFGNGAGLAVAAGLAAGPHPLNRIYNNTVLAKYPYELRITS